LFLAVVVLEAGLRFGGFVVLSLQEYRNLNTIRHKGTYRIMCLGESTTQGQYPFLLEKILNQRNIGVTFSVIDKGVGGIRTLGIATLLEFNLAAYAPDMVITMMGINDGGPHIPYEAAPASKIMFFVQSLRTYKLTKLLWLHILTKARETGLYSPTQDKQHSRKIPFYLLGIGLKEAHAEQANLVPTEDALKQAIALNPKDDHAYTELGWFYQKQGQPSQAEDALKQAIALGSQDYRAYTLLGWFYQRQGKFSQAEDLFKQAIALDPQNDRAYGALSILCEETGKPGLAKEYAQKATSLRLGHYVPLTVTSYRTLKEILDKRGIRLVCVQYPMRSVEPLKRILQGTEKGIIFVDNEKLFRDAVRKDGYNTYFKDMFGGDFGHCTDRGNRLLAENIADTIVKEAFHK
jgi:tetratricopeptide (TPR) repeat protein